jgi:hypothetical protein
MSLLSVFDTAQGAQMVQNCHGKPKGRVSSAGQYHKELAFKQIQASVSNYCCHQDNDIVLDYWLGS